MKSNIKLLTTLTGLFLAASVQAVPNQWSGNNHWYEFIAVPLTVSAARNAATSSTFNGESGYLVTVLSQAEQDFVNGLLPSGNFAWIGASDALSEGDWIWMDGPEAGQALTYTFWAPGEPNDFQGGEDYAVTNWGVDGRWADGGPPGFPDAVPYGYIVEYNGVPAPAPIALLSLGLAGFGFRQHKKIKAV